MKKMILPEPFGEDFLYNVRRPSFKQLAQFGYVVERIDDGAKQLEWNEQTANDMPEEWKRPQGVIVPEVAILTNAILYRDGSVLLPPKRGHHDQYIFFNGGAYGSGNLLNKNQEKFLIQVNQRRQSHKGSITVPGRCFSTRIAPPTAPGHFFHDVLSRIYYENLGVIVPGRDKIIAPTFQFPMQGILFERIYHGYEILQAPDEAALDVEELLIPANLCSAWAFNSKSIVELAARLRRIYDSFKS